jgi:hypothetical protein
MVNPTRMPEWLRAGSGPGRHAFLPQSVRPLDDADSALDVRHGLIGRVTSMRDRYNAFIKRHEIAWELGMALLAITTWRSVSRLMAPCPRWSAPSKRSTLL